MAKATVRATSNFNDLISDLMEIAKEFPETIKEAAEAQLSVVAEATKTNYTSMIPHAEVGDYVYQSIGYNCETGANKIDAVGMVGGFKLDAVASAFGKNDKRVITKGPNKGKHRAYITAPQLMYWYEFGYTANGKVIPGIPFMSNAFYATITQQDQVFADKLAELLEKRL